MPNTDRCLGCRLQLCLRRKLMIQKSFKLTIWTPSKVPNQLFTAWFWQLLQKDWFKPRLWLTTSICKVNDNKWYRMKESLHGWFARLFCCGCQTNGMNSCFLHQTRCFLQPWWAAPSPSCLHPMMPCRQHWYSGDLSIVHAEWMAIHVPSTYTSV